MNFVTTRLRAAPMSLGSRSGTQFRRLSCCNIAQVHPSPWLRGWRLRCDQHCRSYFVQAVQGILLDNDYSFSIVLRKVINIQFQNFGYSNWTLEKMFSWKRRFWSMIFYKYLGLIIYFFIKSKYTFSQKKLDGVESFTNIWSWVKYTIQKSKGGCF